MTTATTALERCLDPDEYVTVSRFVVEHADGDFTVEFGAHGSDPPVWNLARDPPVDAASLPEWEVVDDGRRYLLLDSDATDALEAREELEAILWTVDAEDAKLVKTFAGAENPVTDLVDLVQHHVINPLREVTP